MNKQRVLWFQDGVKLNAPMSKWNKIDTLTQDLVAMVGNKDFEHVVIDPISCTEKLFKQVEMKDYSCSIDLSGFFGRAIKETLPQLTIVKDFRLSRVRMVSSPRLDGNGFFVSLGSEEVASLKSKMDLSKPLFLDDVAWSGRTIVEAIRILGVNPENTTVGVLSANIGTFGEGKPGAFDILKEKGIRILAGGIVSSPEDDGFHIADFFNFIPNENVFDDILKIWEKRAEMQDLSGEVRKNTENEIKTILVNNKDALFPKAISSEQMKSLQEQGRLYQYGWDSQKFDV